MSNVFIAIQIEREVRKVDFFLMAKILKKREKLMGELKEIRKELDEFNDVEENFLAEV